MRIEMLEQAMASYLKNVEGCDLVATNWEPSEYQLSRISNADIQKTEKLVESIKLLCPGMDIFKRSKLKQFLKQTEVDIIGIKNFDEIYLYDTAFHEAGLNYKATPETVAKKIIRAYIIAELLFQGLKAHIGFVSPVVNKTPNEKISKIISLISSTLNAYHANASIELIFNSTCDDMIQVLIDNADATTSNNDLFIRAVKLSDLARASGKKASKASLPNASSLVTKVNNRDLVFSCVNDMLGKGKLTPSLIADIEDKAWSKKTLDLNFPFLAKNESIAPKDQCRYYARLFMIDGVAYKVVSQWYAKQLKLLQEWHDSF